MLKTTPFVHDRVLIKHLLRTRKDSVEGGRGGGLCMGTAPNVNTQPAMSGPVATASYVGTDIDPSP